MQMLLSYVLRRKNCCKWSWRCGLLDRRTTACLFALYQTQYANDLKSEFVGSFDCLNCGSSRGADIIHDHHPRAFLAKTFDTLARAVLLFAFAYQETVNFAAGHGHGYHNWVGTQG